MARSRRQARSDSYDNDSQTGEDSSNDSGDEQYDTDPTEPDFDEDQLKDAGDVAQLFADNENSPEYYLQQLAEFDESVYTKEDYSKGTTVLLDQVESRWIQFCACLRKDPEQEFRKLSIAILHTFLDWALNLRRSKNGRRLPGIKRKSSLETFWKVFRLVFERATSEKIGKTMNRQMRRVIRKLARKHKLSWKGREKSTMFVEDLTMVVETAISTTKKKFGHGRHRIELCLFLQLAGLTANRPQAVLSLRYRHIGVSLLRDPQGGPHRILIEFKFEYTKGFLGSKDENTYILPEIIFDPSLVLSPHVFLLGLLFADSDFKRVDGEEVLTSAGQLPRLHIRDGCNELPLLLDPALDDVPVFRQTERTLQGIGISTDKCLPYSTLLPWVKSVGSITGFRQVARPYSLRYGAGKALDNSGAVSDSLRNLIMHHADSRTFLKYYLDRRIDKNLPAIIRGLNPDDDIMHAACRVSRTIDPDRPQELTTGQASSVNVWPEISVLIQRRDALRQQLGRPLSQHRVSPKYESYQKLNQELNSARERARNTLLSQIQQKYDQEQPMLEVQRQLSETKLAKSVTTKLRHTEGLPEPQKRLIERILTLPSPTLDQEMCRRTEAIDAVATYCQFEEGITCRLPQNKRVESYVAESGYVDDQKPESETTEVQTKSASPLENAIRSVTKDNRPLFCFICVGQQNLALKKRVQLFSSHGDVSKHIKRKHLQNLSSSTVIACNVCDKKFAEVMHFQRHANDSHSTVTGPLLRAVSKQ
ncbi:unnamed protein product [Penicillium olsonii]|uniref:C2H2-type domain-containing protein n=1 Tax=Penicillium olsonii TaxID=99116 RepID=A0A9W4MNP4_PENOL|nr:unnamed protein product [Penicillium olsonii]CAG8074595.1 unnamed protein product [Penicillium olsonii]